MNERKWAVSFLLKGWTPLLGLRLFALLGRGRSIDSISCHKLLLSTPINWSGDSPVDVVAVDDTEGAESVGAFRSRDKVSVFLSLSVLIASYVIHN